MPSYRRPRSRLRSRLTPTLAIVAKLLEVGASNLKHSLRKRLVVLPRPVVRQTTTAPRQRKLPQLRNRSPLGQRRQPTRQVLVTQRRIQPSVPRKAAHRRAILRPARTAQLAIGQHVQILAERPHPHPPRPPPSPLPPAAAIMRVQPLIRIAYAAEGKVIPRPRRNRHPMQPAPRLTSARQPLQRRMHRPARRPRNAQKHESQAVRNDHRGRALTVLENELATPRRMRHRLTNEGTNGGELSSRPRMPRQETFDIPPRQNKTTQTPKPSSSPVRRHRFIEQTPGGPQGRMALV